EAHHRVVPLQVRGLVDGELGVPVDDVLQRGRSQVPTAGDDLALEAQVADDRPVRRGARLVHAEDALGVRVGQQPALERRHRHGQVSRGVQDLVLDVGLVQDLLDAGQPVLQGRVAQVLKADGDLAGGADQLDDLLAHDVAGGDV